MFLPIIEVMTPPTVSMPNDKGTTSMTNGELEPMSSPPRIPP